MKGVLNQGNTIVEHILPRAIDPLAVLGTIAYTERTTTHTPSFIGEKVKRYLACTVIVAIASALQD